MLKLEVCVCALFLVIHRSVCRQICDGKGFFHMLPFGDKSKLVGFIGA